MALGEGTAVSGTVVPPLPVVVSAAARPSNATAEAGLTGRRETAPGSRRAPEAEGVRGAALSPDTLVGAQEQTEDKPAASVPNGDADNGELSEEEQKEVRELQQRDQEVRRHEQAHAQAGGQYAGSPSYQFEKGPDGRQYAVAGEVPIDVSEVPGDPQATVRKMDVVKRAALAPAEPSAQDRKIAAEAEAKKQQARLEILEQRNQDQAKTDGLSEPIERKGADFGRDGSKSDVSASDAAPENSANGLLEPRSFDVANALARYQASGSKAGPADTEINETSDGGVDVSRRRLDIAA